MSRTGPISAESKNGTMYWASIIFRILFRIVDILYIYIPSFVIIYYDNVRVNGRAQRVYLINFYRSNIFYRYCYIHVDLIPNNPPYTACRVASLHWPGPQPFTSSALQVSCPNGETCTNSTSPCPNRDTFTNSTDCATPWTSQLFICKWCEV